RERFQMHLGKSLLESTQEVGEVGECQVRVESSHNVKFRNSLRVTERGMVIGFIQRHRVAIFAWLTGKTAELTVHHAHVGRVQISVDVEIANAAIPLFACPIGQATYRIEVRRGVKRNSFLKTEPLSGKNLVSYRRHLRTHQSVFHEKALLESD